MQKLQPTSLHKFTWKILSISLLKQTLAHLVEILPSPSLVGATKQKKWRTISKLWQLKERTGCKQVPKLNNLCGHVPSLSSSNLELEFLKTLRQQLISMSTLGLDQARLWLSNTITAQTENLPSTSQTKRNLHQLPNHQSR